MSKKLVYQLCSNDPLKFSEVEFQPLIPWNCNRIKYRVKSLNTFANFLITTKDNVLVFYEDFTGNEETINFEDKTSYEMDDILNKLSDLTFFEKVELTEAGVLRFTKKYSYETDDIYISSKTTYRIRLLLGLWAAEDVDAYGNILIPKEYKGYECPTVPMLCYNNVLYLRSIAGQQIMSRVDKANYSPPVCYRINTFLKSGLPIICDKEKFGEEVETNIEAINNVVIKLELVDFQFHPVILKSPLFICLEISPVEQTYFQSNF